MGVGRGWGCRLDLKDRKGQECVWCLIMMVMDVSIFSDCELVALLEDDTGMEVSLHRKNISP